MHDAEAAGLPGGSRRDRRQQTPEVVLPAAPPVEQPRANRRRGTIWATLAGTALVVAGALFIASGLLKPPVQPYETTAVGAVPPGSPAGHTEPAGGDAEDDARTDCPAAGGESGAALLCAVPDASDSRPSEHRPDAPVRDDGHPPAGAPQGPGSGTGAPEPGDATPGEPTPDGPGTESSTPGDPAPSDPTPSNPTPSNPTPSNPQPSDPAPSNPAPSNPTPSDPAPSDPAPTAPTPGDSEPDEPAPAPEPPAAAAPEPLRFVDLQKRSLLGLLATSYTLVMTGEPGSTARITYGSFDAGTITFDSAGGGSIRLTGSLIDLGLSNPTISASYSDGTDGDPISARRDSI